MALHFSPEEFGARRARICETLAEQGLDALLMFRQESMFYLTGYDSFGYVYFQCLVLTGSGDVALLTRAPDLRQARHTSIIDDIHIWIDGEGVDPTRDLKALLAEMGLGGKRLGVEYEAYGLTASNGRRLDAALGGFAHLIDASELVSRIRLVKSDAELVHVRRAAELADSALDAAIASTCAGADEGAILAAMQGAIFRGGGDFPANEPVIGSGQGALLCRYASGRRRLDAHDQLTLEFAGVERHYHACLMRTLLVGEPDARHRALFDACHETLLACEDRLRPGHTMGEVFDAHADILDAHGLSAHRLNACGYSLGATFAPNWMDWPMVYEGSPVELRPGMVIFLHMIVMDSESGHAMTLGRTSLVGDGAAWPLSQAPLDLVIC